MVITKHHRKEKAMLTANAVGRVTADLELQTGSKTSFVRFNLAVNKGYGEGEHTVFMQCVLFDKAAERIVNAKVKKGSLIWASGDLDLNEYEKPGGVKEKSLKLSVHDWGYIPAGKSKTGDAPQAQPASFITDVDGEYDPLP